MKESIRKYIEIGIRTFLAGVALVCWWSIFFPQMVMKENCYRVLNREGQPVSEAELSASPEWTELPAYWEILEAEQEEVVLTGKLWKYLKDKGWIKE